MNSKRRLAVIKSYLGCKSYYQLAKLLDLPESQIHNWRYKGFHKSTQRLLDAFLERSEIKLKPSLVKRILKTDGLVDRLLIILDCKNDSALARRVDVPRNRVSGWRNRGFYRSTQKLLSAMIMRWVAGNNQ